MKKLFNTRYSDGAFNVALLVLRLAAGGLLIPHGFSKLTNFSSMSHKFADPFHIGIKLSLSLTIFAELFCGVLIVLGLLTRLACIAPIIAMSVALFVAHKGHVFSDGEMAALYLAMFITILFLGPGRASVDGMIGK